MQLRFRSVLRENCPYQVAKPGESVFFDELDEGEYCIGVEGFDEDELIIADGTEKVNVVAGQTAKVSILMKSSSDESEDGVILPETASIYIEINYDTYTTKLTFSKAGAF